MCWCPITSLDYADEAYEWNMGQYSEAGTRATNLWTSMFSQDMAVAYGEYINNLGLADADGNALTLDMGDESIYGAGSYYDALLAEIEHSLNNFLKDTTFPYTSGGSGMPAGGPPDMGTPPEDMGEMPGTPPEGMGGPGGGGESFTYDTVEDYFAALNADEEWVTYDAASNIASITSIGAFVRNCKQPTKDVGAFDDLHRNQAENQVFGFATHDALHFNAGMAALLAERQGVYAEQEGWDVNYVSAYQDDPMIPDLIGNESAARQDAYNPMYYLMPYYAGSDSSSVAKYWRIHSGINQGDTALTVEFNLALALQQHPGTEDLEFEMVWGQGHTMAERAGDPTANFIDWVIGLSL